MRISLLSLFVTIATTAAAQTGPKPADRDGPAVHVYSVVMAGAIRFDPLLADAASQTVIKELAARHGRFAKFHPRGSGRGTGPKDYPRLQLKIRRPQPLKYLRLVRKGNTFTCLLSVDGKEYIEDLRVDLPFPKRTYVGLIADNTRANSKAGGVLTEVTLTGKPFKDPKVFFVGGRRKGKDVKQVPNGWRLEIATTEKAPSKLKDFPFVYRVCEGDFDFTARVEKILGPGQHAKVGLLCQANLDRQGFQIQMSVDSVDNVFSIMGPASETVWDVYPRHSIGRYVATLQMTRNKRKVLYDGVHRVLHWDNLVKGAMRLTDAMLSGLKSQMKYPPRSAIAAVPATREQLVKLRQARAIALGMNSGGVLRASRQIAEVLAKSPMCAEAHYTASLCGALLACQDLYGHFQDRARFLAGPLSHYLLARRLGKPSRAEDHLSEAWIMLACGFPTDAMQVVEKLPREHQKSPEARALRMFATRDYRGLSADKVTQAKPILQLAWLWATQACKRDDLLQNIPGELAMKNRSAAFLPLYRRMGVGPSHRYSIMGISYAYARDASDLLRCEDIPLQRRVALGKRMAKAVGGQVTDDAAKLAKTVAWTSANRGLRDNVASALEPLMDLYGDCLNSAVDSVAPGPGGTTRWRVITPHEFATVQRGLLAWTLHERAKFMAEGWGVPDGANGFCSEVAKGLKIWPEISAFFRAYGLWHLGRANEAGEAAKKALQSNLGNQATLRGEIIRLWEKQRYKEVMKRRFFEYGARGSWDCERRSNTGLRLGIGGVSLYHAYSCLAGDKWNAGAINNIMWFIRDVDIASRWLASMEYHVRAWGGAARYARIFGQHKQAVEFLARVIKIAPNNVRYYSRLAYLYERTDQLDKAIQIGKLAAEHCGPSVGLSNLMGSMAKWLVEQGKAKEALQWGKRSAGSYSHRGLEGLAVALAANGRMDEAADVYRKIAHRYATGSRTFVAFMLGHEWTAEQITDEIKKMLKAHPSMKKTVQRYVVDGFLDEPGHDKILVQLFAGPLSTYSKGNHEFLLGLTCLRARRFGDFLAYTRQIRKVRPLTSYDAFRGYIAARLGRDANAVKEFTAEMTKHAADDKTLGLHIRYILGRIALRQLKDPLKTDSHRAYFHWLLGANAELRGDMKTAMKEYQAAAGYDIPSQAAIIPRFWLKRYGKQWRTATQPAIDRRGGR